jgi:mannose-6-phosphate isomerase-like protein (cupin superfamily)
MDNVSPTSVSSIATSPRYEWGAACEGWHLLASPSLSVIQERMPPGTSEVRHSHDRARQFFFALDGTLSIELAGERFTLESGQGLHVPAGEPHRVFNEGPSAVQFLVVSQPPSHGDRRTEPELPTSPRGS